MHERSRRSKSSGRPLHARLARAYAGLAATYHEGKRHDLAVENFQQAVALTRRHEGLLTEAQVPLLEKYIDSLTELGRFPEALQGYKYILRIATRKYGETSPALAPTLERIGRWYTQVGLYDQARRTFRRAIDLVETGEGQKSPKLIGPLTALAACNRRQLIDPDQELFTVPDAERTTLYHDPVMGPSATVSPQTLATEGERALLRAADIADERAEPSPVQVADVRTQVGDWYQSRGMAERALPNYQKAWLAASRVAQRHEGKPIVEALFGAPVLLQIVRPEGWDRFAARPPEQVETRNVVVEFTVNADGFADKVKVIDDSGDARRAQRTTEALHTARYRPRMENGVPVATTGISFTQPWILLLPTAEEGKSSPSVGQAGLRVVSHLVACGRRILVSLQAAAVLPPRRAAGSSRGQPGRARSPVRETPPRAWRPRRASRAASRPAAPRRPCPGTRSPAANRNP